MDWTTRRTARKRHACSWGLCRNITPGEVYLEHVQSPNGDAGYVGWTRVRECADCATRYGRAHKLDEVRT